MATVIVDPKAAVWYDPDGPNAPLTLLFPDTSTVPAGTRIKLQNGTTSFTPVTYLAQGADTIANPEDVADFQVSHSVAIAELIVEYMAVGNQWRLCGHGDPDLAKNALQFFQSAAYGGLYLSADTPGASLGSGWETLAYYDSLAFPTPRLITQNLVNGSLTPQFPGVYNIIATLNFGHNESNQGRATYLRSYNLTTGTPSRPLGIPIARNQPGTLLSVLLAMEMPTDEFVLQIGGGDSVTSVNWLNLDFQLTSAGEFRGQI